MFPIRDRDPSDAMTSDGPTMDGPTSDGIIACPIGYSDMGLGGSSQYKLSTADRQGFGGNTSGGAAMACAGGSQGSGITHLVVFDDQEEFDGLRTLNTQFRWVGHRRSTPNDPFIPVSLQSPGTFPPSTGSPWATNEPDVADLCMAIDQRNGGQLTALDCTFEAEYICECDGISPNPSL